ncbi:hypothetical protein ES705_06142 [subsurface metagenome]|nr:hypothetical protein [Methanosarcinales archaeon]
MGKEMDWGTLLRESAANIRQLSLYYPVEKDAAKVTRKHPSGANQLLAMAKPWVVPIR